MGDSYRMKRLQGKYWVHLILVFTMSLFNQALVYAFSDEVTGYYMGETNECPNAITAQKKDGNWPGVKITPVDISFADGTPCTLSEESHRSNILYLTLTCTTKPERSGIYGFEIHGNQLVVARKNGRESYVRCRNLASNTPNDLSENGRPNTGLDVGGGAKVHPYANNNSMRMRMNVPFP